MSDFYLYFGTGWHHIISKEALDHILFIVALASIYQLQNWRRLLVLVTAFTIGHSLTLALSVYDFVRFSQNWVEFLIPCTIVATAVYNFALAKKNLQMLHWNYLIALIFGLIHGMGFANSIRFMLSGNQGIAIPLISFNIGLEVGQLFVVTILLALGYVFVDVFKMKQAWWTIGLSSIAFILALKMAIERVSYLL